VKRPCGERKKLGIWTCDYDIVTGQANVTRELVDSHFSAVYRLRLYKFGQGLLGVPSWIAAWARLWMDFLRNRHEVLYIVCSRSHLGFIRDVPALILSRLGVRCVVHAHGADICELLNSRWYSQVAQSLYAQVVLVVPSQHLKKRLAGVAHDVRVCENFAGLEEPSYPVVSGHTWPRGHIGAHNEVVRLVWNSNIMASKGFFTLIDACQRARRAGIGVDLIALGAVMGDDELSKAECNNACKALVSETWIQFRGVVNQSEVFELLLSASFGIFISRHSGESQGIALVEAMLLGLPILAARSEVIETTLGTYPAKFLSSGDAAEICDAILEFHCGSWPVGSESELRSIESKKAISRFGKERFFSEIDCAITGSNQNFSKQQPIL